ncbi:MAG: ABC transporter substrate-binding protein [Oligoflexales bacterium]
MAWKALVWALALSMSSAAFAANKLVIISPHRKSIQEEYVPKFEGWYQKTYKEQVKVDWLDQGGTSDDVRFVKSKFDQNAKTSGIDIFWGGGATAFIELNQSKLLESYTPETVKNGEVPAKASGVNLYDKQKTWFASAISSFGIFYNKKILKFDGLKEPATWADLGDFKYFGNVSSTDPRRSGTANTMNTIIIKSLGWDEGWKQLTKISANTKTFTHSSSDPIKAVVSGDVAAAMAIDFYALAKIGDLGENNLGFILPKGQTILDPDPIAILKGAPNEKVAQRFVDFVLSNEGQKLLVLAKGQPDGPDRSTLGRMAINTKTYKDTEGKRLTSDNPFVGNQFFNYDVEDVARHREVFNDLFGALFVDTHEDLKKAWQAAQKQKNPEAALAEIAKLPVTEKEFEGLSAKWGDDVFRNKKINEWVSFAKKKYSGIASH